MRSKKDVAIYVMRKIMLIIIMRKGNIHVFIFGLKHNLNIILEDCGYQHSPSRPFKIERYFMLREYALALSENFLINQFELIKFVSSTPNEPL